MYPGIIVEYGISPENISGGNTAFLSMFLRELLDRRLLYKAMANRLEIYENRNKTLKLPSFFNPIYLFADPMPLFWGRKAIHM